MFASSTSSRQGFRIWVVLALALPLWLAGCGGGDDNDNAQGGIGAAGGTVTAADGARVVVPAGALAQATDLAIEADDTGAPALPAGTTTVGATYALTPHGTSFSQPVTLTVPFDPAQVPAGAAVQLLKTNAAQDAWEAVAGATVDGSTVSAPLSGFSWVVPVAGAPITGGLSGNWTSLYNCETTSGEPFSGEDTLAITQTGNQVSFTVSDGSSGTGTVDGDTVTWSSTGPGYTERGTWTILDEDSMVKRSTYTNSPDIGGGGTCSGSIHKDS